MVELFPSIGLEIRIDRREEVVGATDIRDGRLLREPAVDIRDGKVPLPPFGASTLLCKVRLEEDNRDVIL